VHRLNEAARTNDIAGITEIRDAMSEIAYAWAALAN
jgi:flagellin-specific chaperone FliS